MMTNENGKSLSEVISELKAEVKLFLETRSSMLASEMRERVSAIKSAAPAIAVGGLLLFTAWFLITGAIAAAVYVAFAGSDFAVAIALALTGAAYAIGGGIAVWLGSRTIKESGLLPNRTLQVLREDRQWLRQEVRTGV